MSSSHPSNWNANLYIDKHAFVYDYGHALVEMLAPQKDERILDLGCGTGQLTAELYKYAAHVIGMDKSEEMVAKASTLYSNIEFCVGDAEDFQFEEPFDTIFSNATLHWVLNHQAAIRCMHHALRPEGRLVLEMGGKGNVQTIVQQLRQSLASHGFLAQSKTRLWYFPSIGEYSSALESAGFHVQFAEQFERPTKLTDSESGIRDWLRQFGMSFFRGLTEAQVSEIVHEVQQSVKEKLHINGEWYADYQRLRIVAIRNNI